MNTLFYFQLALNGIKKNRNLYFPYIMAGSTMVLVYYVFSYLGYSKIVGKLPGKEVLPVLFSMGAKSIVLFSIPFLFYLNSSILKKRKKELGLYNILGMNKKNIFYVLLCENILTYFAVMAVGILFGIAFSKLSELGLVNIMNKDVNFNFYIDLKSLLKAFMVFALIFILILLNEMRLIRKNKPIELLNSENIGEKAPKNRKIYSLISLISLIISYILISGLSFPLNYMKVAIAGALFILGNFGIFICFSIFIIKMLQKNKKFYYKTEHFIGLSSMSYRMKRNGASLAIICIILTFILSTLAFSISFYKGSMNVINEHYPFDMGFSVKVPEGYLSSEKNIKSYTKNINSEIKYILKDKNEVQSFDFQSANMLSVIDNGSLNLGYNMKKTWFVPGYYEGWERDNKKIVYVHILSLNAYNKVNNKNEKLKDDEIIFISDSVKYKNDFVKLFNGEKVKIKSKTDDVPKMTEVRIDGASLNTHGCEEIYLITNNVYDFIGQSDGVKYYEKYNYMSYNWESDININANETEQKNIYNDIIKFISNNKLNENSNVNDYLKIERIENFYAFGGALLFLSIIMNILFILVASIIMYYKQISEGFEDQKNFVIMKKIGLNEKEIKRSINFQMLIVFLLPIIIAGINFIFTSNFVYILLKYAVIDNKSILTNIMKITYVIFFVIYTLVYLVTSRKYLKIINSVNI